MENLNSSKRIVFQYHFKHFTQESDIIHQFFAFANYAPKNYFIHSIPTNASTKMYTVLDLNHEDNPTADIEEIPYEVFQVMKNDTFEFKDLGSKASERAAKHFQSLYWGTDRR
ncbi:hypothetical protein GQ44DRAFT_832304 [Phaeosphaeriaceae sp. PMI808]|nr:hypothetical protein GQ44DRAFT_832304 [Phaeosphaeriaceae sp. PMI808]